MGCATSLVKFFVFLFNFVCVAGALFLIVFGALFYKGYNEYKDLLPEAGSYQYPPVLMIVVGLIVFIIAFFGCCGTCRESKCMMMTYATLLLILLIAEIGIVLGIYYNQNGLKDWLKSGLDKSMEDYDNKVEVREAWDTLQSTFHCCGVDSYTDWKLRLPKSCCVNKAEDCTSAGTQFLSLFNNKEIWNEGCVETIFTALKTDYGMIGAAILAGVELLGVIFGCCLGARFGRKNYNI